MRKLRKVVVIVVVVLLALFLVVYFSIGALLRKGVETEASAALGVTTTVSSVHLNPFTGSVRIQDLNIHNPEGYKNPSFLTARQASVQVNLGSLMTREVTVKDISIDGMVVTIEGKGFTTNLQAILDHLKSNQPASTSTETKGYHIQRIGLAGTVAHFALAPTPDVTVKLPDIEIKDLGTGQSNGVKLTLVMLTVLTKVAEEAAIQSAGKIPAEITNGLRGVAENAGKALNELGTEARKGLQDILKNVPQFPKGN